MPAASLDGLLVDCLSQTPQRELQARLAVLTVEEWERLSDLAASHRVAPILLRRLRDVAATGVPESVETKLRDSHQRTAMRNMSRLRQLRRLLNALEARGIDAVVLKGAYLACAVYGDPALRDMADVDVLVRRQDLAEAYRVLLELACATNEMRDLEEQCAKHHHLPPVTMPAAGPLEMHWSITPPGLPVTIDMDGVWSRAAEIRIAGARAMAMSPEDLLLHLSIHASLQHRFRMRLRHLYDIAATLLRFRNEIDWDRLGTVANASGAGRFVYCTLRVAEDVLGAPVPRASVARLTRNAGDEAILPVVREYFLATSLELPVAYRAARDAQGLRRKAEIVLESIVPTPARMRSMYGLPANAASVYFYYPIRVADLVARRGRVLIEMARGSSRFRLTLRREKMAKQIDQWVDRS